MPTDLQNDPSVATTVTLSPGQVIGGDLTDAATIAASTMSRTTHQSTGVPAVGFGSAWLDRLANAANTFVDAFTLTRRWVTAAAAAEDSAVDFFASRAGALVKLLTLNAKNATGNYPVEIPNFNSDTAAVGFTANSDQEVHKLTGGNLTFRARNAIDAQVSLLAANNIGVVVHMSSTHADVVACDGNVVASDVDGFFWIPAVTATGAQSGTPRGIAVGQVYTGHAPCIFNKADNKLWIHNGTAWKSVTLA